MISTQNTILPHLGADIRPQHPDGARAVNLLAAILDRRLSPKMTIDDNGNWVVRDIHVLPVGAGQLEVPAEGGLLRQACLRRRAGR